MTNEKKSQKQKKPYCGILSAAMRAYILSDKKQGYNKSEYNKRLVEYTKISLTQDLPLLLEKLDEETQAKIFNEENLTPFFSALFKFDSSILNNKDNEERRKRLLKLGYEFLTLLGIQGTVLAPNVTEMLKQRILVINPEKTPVGINSILLEAYRNLNKGA